MYSDYTTWKYTLLYSPKEIIWLKLHVIFDCKKQMFLK